MSNLSQVQVGSTTYDLRDYYKSGIYFVEGTHSIETNDWTGVLNGVDELYDGLTIAYYLPYVGEGVVTLTLSLNGVASTGPINCYIGTNRITNEFTPGMIVLLTYCSAGSISVNGVVTIDNRWVAQAGGGNGEGAIAYIITKGNVNSVSVDGNVGAADISEWTPNYPTQVEAKTVVTGGTTTTITPVTSKTVVTSASGATASIATGVLTITNGSFSTGASVNTETAIAAYTSLTTGSSVIVTPGTAATLSYSARVIPNITVTPVGVVVDLTPTGASVPSVVQDPETRGLVIS